LNYLIFQKTPNILSKIQQSLIKIVYPLTCEGAAINPTAMPHATRPMRIATWLVDSAIMHHPHNNGIIDKSSVFFLPYAFIIGVDTNDPIGVASECIDAIVHEEKIKNKQGEKKCGLK